MTCTMGTRHSRVSTIRSRRRTVRWWHARVRTCRGCPVSARRSMCMRIVHPTVHGSPAHGVRIGCPVRVCRCSLCVRRVLRRCVLRVHGLGLRSVSSVRSLLLLRLRVLRCMCGLLLLRLSVLRMRGVRGLLLRKHRLESRILLVRIRVLRLRRLSRSCRLSRLSHRLRGRNWLRRSRSSRLLYRRVLCLPLS